MRLFSGSTQEKRAIDKNSTRMRKRLVSAQFFVAAAWIVCGMSTGWAADFPAAAGWHRGNVAVAQENSKKALLAAFRSQSPNIEVDIIDFANKNGERVGLLAHDYGMERITGSKGNFIDRHDIALLPPNATNPDLSPEPYMSVIELFELIKEVKSQGITPVVSLDMKEEGDSGKDFGKWVGELIKKYKFQEHVFASSFFKSNIEGVDESCPECMTGGLVFNDHFALKHLDYHHTSLDLNGFSKMTFFVGFLGKGEYPHDFVLIQDDILISHPELIDYWKLERKVKFVGAFVYNKERSYTEKEWEVLRRADWLELDPLQMEQKIKMAAKKNN
jgi:hypothetical protein